VAGAVNRWLAWNLAAGAYAVAWILWWVSPPPLARWLPSLACAVASWLAYCAVTDKAATGIVLRLWGLTWTRDEACCHFFISGGTGTGKTARAIVPIVHGLRATLPDTGILAIDSKAHCGSRWRRWPGRADRRKTCGLSGCARRGAGGGLDAAVAAQPARRSAGAGATYAKILVDTATAAGQKGGHAFFKEVSRDLITNAMTALHFAGLCVTLDNVHDAICVSERTKELLKALDDECPEDATEKGTRWQQAKELRKYFADFDSQPPEQKAGTVYSVANFLRPYRPPEIAEVFSRRTRISRSRRSTRANSSACRSRRCSRSNANT